MPDPRSTDAAQYRHLYKTAAWQKLRLTVLTRDMFTCQKCGRLEGKTSQLVADHKQPHRGNLDLFWSADNLQTLCARCHNSDKQSQERLGFSKDIDASGWPSDPKHPSNGDKMANTDGLGAFSHPAWFRPVFVPLSIVCGPPASGKSTWVDRSRAPGDLVIDLDAIAMDGFGVRVSLLDSDRRLECLRRRNELLADLMREDARGKLHHAWLIVSEPHAHKRQWWADTLRPERIIVIETPAEECIRRARADIVNARQTNIAHVIGQWWTVYRRRPGDTVLTST